MVKCVVKGCNSYYLKDNTISYFSFPHEYSRLQLWLNKVNLPKMFKVKKITNTYRVCGKHFKRNMFKTDKLNRLYDFAIPTLYLGNEIDAVEKQQEQNEIATNSGCVKTPEIRQDDLKNKLPKDDDDVMYIKSERDPVDFIEILDEEKEYNDILNNQDEYIVTKIENEEIVNMVQCPYCNAFSLNDSFLQIHLENQCKNCKKCITSKYESRIHQLHCFEEFNYVIYQADGSEAETKYTIDKTEETSEI